MLRPGYIPAPMIFGAIIDSTCRLWERGGDSAAACRGGATGSCLLFDTDQLRWRTYGVSLVVQLLQLTFAILLYLAIRRRSFTSDEEPPTKNALPVADGAAKPPPSTEGLPLIEVNSTHPLDGHADGKL